MKVPLLLLTALFYLVPASTSSLVIEDLVNFYTMDSQHYDIIPCIIYDKFREYFEQNKKDCFYRLYEYSFTNIAFVDYALKALQRIHKDMVYCFIKIKFLHENIERNIILFSEDYQLKIDYINILLKLFRRLLEHYEANNLLENGSYERWLGEIEKLKRDLKKDEFQMKRFSYMKELSNTDKLNLLLGMYYNLKQNTSNDLVFETNLNRFCKYSHYLVLNLKKKEILEFLYRKPDDFILLFFYLSHTYAYHLMNDKSRIIDFVTKREIVWVLQIALKNFLKFTDFKIELNNNKTSIGSSVLSDEETLFILKDIYKNVFKKRFHLLEAWQFLSIITTNLKAIIDLKGLVESFLISCFKTFEFYEEVPIFGKFISPLIANPHNGVQIKTVVISSLTELIRSFNRCKYDTFNAILILFDFIKNNENISLLETIFDTIHILLDKNQLYPNDLIILKDHFKEIQLEEIINQLLNNENEDTIIKKGNELIQRIETLF